MPEKQRNNISLRIVLLKNTKGFNPPHHSIARPVSKLMLSVHLNILCILMTQYERQVLHSLGNGSLQIV